MDDLNRAVSRTVQRFLGTLIAEVKRAVLDQAAKGLSAPAPSTSRARAPRRSLVRARPQGKLSDQLLRVIAAKPGLRAEELRAQVGGEASTVRAELHRLRVDKLVVARGKARGMRYARAKGRS